MVRVIADVSGHDRGGKEASVQSWLTGAGDTHEPGLRGD